MEFFNNDGFEIAYLDRGRGEPILLIHGFASSTLVNWVNPGWVKTIEDAGYRAIAFDHRGHGRTSKSYDEADYSPQKMGSDAIALLDHIRVERAHVLGYSMGARVAALMGLDYPDHVATLVLGGLGSGLVDGVGDWDPIADALRAEDAATVTHPRGKMFRDFADRTKSDRLALAACIRLSRGELTRDQVGAIGQPTLVAAGTNDDIGGRAGPLAAMLPNGEAFDIEGRDHMLAVGDRTFKARALQFWKDHPLG